MRFSCWTGGTTAQVCRLPRRGETDARFKSLLKHRVGGGAAPAMHPSSASADFTGTAILRLCFGRAVFVCQTLFLLDWGARLRRSVGCPEGARQTRVSNRCSSIAWAAGPPQRCTPVQQALILPVLRFYGSASAELFLFVRCFSCWTGGTTAQAGKSKLFSRWLDIFAD